MLIVRNKILPFKGFIAINLCGIIFVRAEVKLSASDLQHEKIHSRQMAELAYIPFYTIYFMEWIYRSIRYQSFTKGYYNISFEREAYLHQHDRKYLRHRPRWNFLNYW